MAYKQRGRYRSNSRWKVGQKVRFKVFLEKGDRRRDNLMTIRNNRGDRMLVTSKIGDKMAISPRMSYDVLDLKLFKRGGSVQVKSHRRGKAVVRGFLRRAARR